MVMMGTLAGWHKIYALFPSLFVLLDRYPKPKASWADDAGKQHPDELSQGAIGRDIHTKLNIP